MMAGDLTEHLSHVINLSFSSGVFPAVLKHDVLPIHKKNNASAIANYRPISVLSSFSKVFERIVMNRMTDYLNKFNLIWSCQHDYQS